jgi:formimidoylglutamate deiminase
VFWIEPAALYRDGSLQQGLAVLVSGTDGAGRILEVCPRREDGLRVESHPRAVLLPGFVNAHSHAFQRGLRGWVQHAAGEDSFWSWRERMYGLAARLDPEAVEAITALAYAEMLGAGFTSVGEFHYLHHQPDGTPYADPDELAKRVLAAGARVGLRTVLLRVAYARAGAAAPRNPRQARFLDGRPEAVLEAAERLRASGATVGLAPHSVRAVPADWLRVLADFDGVVHAHVDEQPEEIRQCLAEHGRAPLEVFGDAGLLGPRFTAVHLTHPDEAELSLLHASGSRVCACPTTELDLGDGFFPAWKVNAPVCIGSDSHAAIDPFAELRALEWHSRAVLGRRNVLPHDGEDGLAARLLDAGTANGADALGLPTGRILAGQLADLVAVDTSRIEFALGRPLPTLVFNGSPAAVREVWVGGRHVVRDGRVPGSEAIAREALRALRRVSALA